MAETGVLWIYGWIYPRICQQEWIWLTSQKYQSTSRRSVKLLTLKSHQTQLFVIPLPRHRKRWTQKWPSMTYVNTGTPKPCSLQELPTFYLSLLCLQHPDIYSQAFPTQFFTSCTLFPSHYTLQSNHRSFLPPDCCTSLFFFIILFPPFPSQNLKSALCQSPDSGRWEPQALPQISVSHELLSPPSAPSDLINFISHQECHETSDGVMIPVVPSEEEENCHLNLSIQCYSTQELPS